MNFRRAILTSIHVVCLAALLLGSATFGWFFHERYWRWRDCIADSSSSCGDPESFNATSGGAVWLVPCVILLIMAVGGILHLLASGRRKS